ncbi:MAG: DNA-directed RNA polymerase subunit beta' [Candidatus Marinimicrobia bacterium]|nr:DNA-directed RNA polymerase subunit beta' [Candidatus Neomarinimicrobiota bacterium]MBT4129425.1 DNA-directed RNA polymerase subunit beta' [Candidatus Neomarinimicrobiota bacterium]MBT4295536.1 DNA-directed RNA polymerase subunit beta' [Candidatus Neomarinimicrobiota bacterium]MBT5467386.1 DNA-directed RNA polymerase subunit beta' [Candidatus Neomarinimicrobiota bacterium]MBT7199052.1 DNA-directed RNA polymerase subunit beta' [Candidatus Neomarinimicrobiota bacterium]
MLNKSVVNDFTEITIRLASPEKILRESRGEIFKPETINYRTYKPEKDGLFCERIFGPVKDWECHCGKYKRIRYKGIICDRCGVEVTRKKVRRERMGHITLAVPVVHTWYLRSIPSTLAHTLGMTSKNLERIIYYESYVVISPGKADVEPGEILDEEDFIELDAIYGPDALGADEEDVFIAKTGGEAILSMLRELEIKKNMIALKEIVKTTRSQQKKADALKRLRMIKAFDTKPGDVPNRPEWMVLTILPVIPPELRPLVPLDGGRFAASDLNDLYRRVIIRNNRLRQLMEIKAPDVILRNEKRMLQESVDSLFDNSRKQSAVRSGTRRPLKSLSDMLSGKQGRFRQNLLGKRVDYSGRSVIVVGPDLKLHECGIPKEMAIELFKPHIISELLVRNYAKTPKQAKVIVEEKQPEIYDVLEFVVKDHPVMLNRAPTLHRLGIQAFQPVLINGRAIRLHPLVCSAFNADFDGDQMAVHLPLSAEAITEARMLMLSSHNILHPAHGSPITVPSQDMVIGCYYLTKVRPGTLGEGMIFTSPDEVYLAVEAKHLDYHAKIKVRMDGELLETTAGRLTLNDVLPEGYPFMNELITKKRLENLISDVMRFAGNFLTVKFLDDLKKLGFEYATKSGVSIGLSDILIPEKKTDLLDRSSKEVDKVNADRKAGWLTEGERYNKVLDIWTHTTNQVAGMMMDALRAHDDGFNSVFMMADSGARGSSDQIKQLAGMRGLMAKPQKSLKGSQGEIIETPITSNFKEGLSVLEYFISTHGARKGLADTALKTADAGYLTRRLVDVAQDVVIRLEDCGTISGIDVKALKQGEDVIEPLQDRIKGRVLQEDVFDPLTDEMIAEVGVLVHEALAMKIAESNVEKVRIRSVLTCEAEFGVCAKCYGRNMSTAKLVNAGEAVGIMAAQAIGEPGTQLTLRTFHIGGTAARIIEESEMSAKFAGTIRYSPSLRVTDQTEDLGRIALVRNNYLEIVDENNRALTRAIVPYASTVEVADGEKVTKGQGLVRWDPRTDFIIAQTGGTIRFVEIVEDMTFVEESGETGKIERTITDARGMRMTPRLEICDESGVLIGKDVVLPVGAVLTVDDGQKIPAGTTLAKFLKGKSRTADITGGLPRVAELFEARNPADPSVVTEVAGIVHYGDLKRGVRTILVETPDAVKYEYSIPYGRHIIVLDGDNIQAGDRLCEGPVSPKDILRIKGEREVQEYLVNEIQEVYRLQGVRINDKHIETIVRQMMQKVQVENPGDTQSLHQDRVNKFQFQADNAKVLEMVVVEKPGESEYTEYQLVDRAEMKETVAELKANSKALPEYRDAEPATHTPLLLGITRASLNTESIFSAASFQETTRVLTNAAINAKTDTLRGLKENIIVGRLIPAGTGLPKYGKIQAEGPANEIAEQVLEVRKKRDEAKAFVRENSEPESE